MTKSAPVITWDIQPELRQERLRERARCVGAVLAEVGKQKAAGHHELAAILDRMATQIEHPLVPA